MLLLEQTLLELILEICDKMNDDDNDDGCDSASVDSSTDSRRIAIEIYLGTRRRTLPIVRPHLAVRQSSSPAGPRKRSYPSGVVEEKEGQYETSTSNRGSLFKSVARAALLQAKIRVDKDSIMRRGTLATLNVPRPKDGSGFDRRGRLSLGHVYKEGMDKNDHNNLARKALQEDIRKRALLRKLKFAIRFRILLERWWKQHASQTVSQTHPLYTMFELIQNSIPQEKEHYIHFEPADFKANKQMRMSQEAKRILTKKPEDRTPSEVHYAMIALRGIDSIADYPIRMQQALAKYGRVECYGPKRILVRQGHPPEAFYFILYGTVLVAIQDPESPYAKMACYLYRGENFGELAIAHMTNRQSTVITKEYSEFLSINCETYEKIFMVGGVRTIHDPDHVNFLKSLDFLQGWPLEQLDKDPKAIQFCFFRRNTVMVHDSNFSDWIYIVKSGSLSVLKKLQKEYPTVSPRTGHYRKAAHTNGYLAFLAQEGEYARYKAYNGLEMPRPLSASTINSEISDKNMNSCSRRDRYGEKENNPRVLSPRETILSRKVDRTVRPRTAHAGVLTNHSRVQVETIPSTVVKRTKSERRERSMGNRKRVNSFHESPPLSQPKMISQTQSSSAILIPPPEDKLNDHLGLAEPRKEEEPVGKRTLIDDLDFASRHVKKEITAADLDPEFVLVQKLTKGQNFGLQHMTLKDQTNISYPLFEDQPSLSLVSNGAECIMLSKTFYIENCSPAMIGRLRAVISPFPTDDEMQGNLNTRVNWATYRKINLNHVMRRYHNDRPARMKKKDEVSLLS